MGIRSRDDAKSDNHEQSNRFHQNCKPATHRLNALATSPNLVVSNPDNTAEFRSPSRNANAQVNGIQTNFTVYHQVDGSQLTPTGRSA